MKVQLYIDDEIINELDKMAKKLGMTRNGLCKYYIGKGLQLEQHNLYDRNTNNIEDNKQDENNDK